jgi:chorismate dehydratase
MRIGAVSYLNTKPLVYGLAELAPRHELVFDLPSRLADDLAAGRLDIALIPSIEFFKNPTYTIVSDACIACRGPVRSVKLLSRVPPANIRTLALDEGSRTSVALVRILLRQRLQIEPKFVPLPIDALPEHVKADALLLIGDRAIHPPGGQFASEWDLGDVWCRWAELPFVFAMWVGRKGSGFGVQGSEGAFEEIGTLLSQTRDLGLANIESIAAAEHAAVGLSYEDCLIYFRDQLYFHLGPRELAGLRLFREHATRLGLAPPDEALPSPSRVGRRAPPSPLPLGEG